MNLSVHGVQKHEPKLLLLEPDQSFKKRIWVKQTSPDPQPRVKASANKSERRMGRNMTSRNFTPEAATEGGGRRGGRPHPLGNTVKLWFLIFKMLLCKTNIDKRNKT